MSAFGPKCPAGDECENKVYLEFAMQLPEGDITRAALIGIASRIQTSGRSS